MNQLATLNTEALEDLLQIRSWGRWAKPQFVGHKTPGWVKEILSGWRESPREYVPEVSDEYAMALDSLIARLPDRRKKVIIGIYVFRMPITYLSRKLSTSKHTVIQERDAAMWYLYGALDGY